MQALSYVKKLFPPPHFMAPLCVGVDISDTSMKYIQFRLEHGGNADLEIAHWGDIKVPEGAIERGTIHDQDKLASTLAQIKDKTGSQHVCMSLPEERAYLFETTVTGDTKRDEIRGLLDFHLEENVPLSPQDAYFDYEIVGIDPQTHELRVVVAVYARSTINTYYDACRKAGLTPVGFEIEAQAIARSAIPKNNHDAHLIVDFGKTRMGIGIVYKNMLMYTSTLDFAGEHITQHIKEVLGDMSPAEAIKIANTRGLASTKENTEVANALTAYVEGVAEELKVRVQYWDSRGVEQKKRAIKKVILCGGASNLFGLSEFLSEQLGIPAERAQVWSNVFSLDEYVPEITRPYSYGYATAIGLALKNFA